MKKLGYLIICLVILSGCNEEVVVRDLEQNQANLAVTMLGRHGIAGVVARETGAGAKYSVEVAQEYYSRALSILMTDKTWQESYESFRDITASRGIIPNSREMELVRLDHALGLELQEILRSIPGVSAAEVIVRSKFVEKGMNPSVSAVVTQISGSYIDKSELVSLIAGSIPGVSAENVIVIIKPMVEDKIVVTDKGIENLSDRVVVEPLVNLMFPLVRGYRVAQSDHDGIVTVFSLVFGLGIVASLCLGFVFGYNYELVVGKKRSDDNREGQRL